MSSDHDYLSMCRPIGLDDSSAGGANALALSLVGAHLARNVESEETRSEMLTRYFDVTERIAFHHDDTVLETNMVWAHALVEKTHAECDRDVELARIRGHTEISLAGIRAEAQLKSNFASVIQTAVACSIAPSSHYQELDVEMSESRGGWFSSYDYRQTLRLRRR